MYDTSDDLHPIVADDSLESLWDSIEPISDEENNMFFPDDADHDLIADDDAFDYSDEDDEGIAGMISFGGGDKFGLISTLRDIVQCGTPKMFSYRSHTAQMIEVNTARVALSIYDHLNTDNQSIFEYIGSISPNSLGSILYMDC